MATHAETTKPVRDRGRIPYRFTAQQVRGMIEAGILGEGDDFELWDGVLYKMVKGELHNFIVSQVADALRRLSPEGCHVREEKSCAFGERSLPEPDVAVCRGRKGDYLPDPPHLARLALVVEVDHHTKNADAVVKYHRYAAVGIPVYWLVDAEGLSVRVFGSPRGSGTGAGYEASRVFESGDELPIEIDGVEVGRVAVEEFFPVSAGD
jgi:Uma2 family endonuclease